MEGGDHDHAQAPARMSSSSDGSANTSSHQASTINAENVKTNPSPIVAEMPTPKDIDELVVDWDGPDDPAFPKNWTKSRKWRAAITVATFTFISPVTSSIGAPGRIQISEQFHITNSSVVAMTTSVFVLAYAFGPFVLAPLCEIYGRSRVIQGANAFFLAWNIACGFAQNTGQLIGFRFLAGLGGSAPLAIGGGVLSDCFRPEERGRAVSLYSLAPVLGPVLGPVAGAWIVDQSTWRWTFWATSAADAVILAVSFLTFEETYAPVLLSRKARHIVKNWDPEKAHPKVVRTPFRTEHGDLRKMVTTALVRPFQFLRHEPIIQLFGIYMAFLYATTYLILTTLPDIYQRTYHERVGIAGLHYLALGLGMILTAQLTARGLDRFLMYFTKKNGGVMKPEFRLPCSVPGTIALPIGLLIVGWGSQEHAPWIVPDIGLAFVGCGLVSNFICIQSYIVDCYRIYSASALAAVSCLRCLCAFGFPLFAPAMYKALGFGKGDTILAAAAIAIGCPAPWIFWFYGERIRKMSRFSPTLVEIRN
ncbi:hypothetical protein EVG20_g202 [Dentipellis fragilis]|uniref:Major facilitator superfamily (MFS) profile domain-containing protein n=1 Tax=Dentipellis fragilis TaxID=205917 RepID=A0A4Y9ZF36_9AGAM|nr:hypothetical protein EVG20_g202 [Dentipellis fragilis]